MSEIGLEEYKEAWREMSVREARRGFLTHLAAYIIVNAYLIFINLWTTPTRIWFVWVLAGWGMGIVFHGVFTRPSFILSDLRRKEALAELIAREKKKKES